MVDKISGLLNSQIGTTPELKGKPTDDSFSKMLKESIEKVNKLHKEADKALEKIVSGDAASVHDVIIAAEKANLSFNLMLQVRNKLVEAYQEIMRMQV